MDDTGTVDNQRNAPDGAAPGGKAFAVVDHFDRGPHLYSTRTSEGFEAIDKRTGERVVLWVLRFPLSPSSEEANRFTKRLEKLQGLRLPTPAFRSFGVDSRGTAYLITDLSNARPLIDSTHIPYHMERMFVEVLKAIEPLHTAGLFLGDIGEDSFMLSPDGKVLLLGVMGAFESGARQTAMLPPSETLHYIAPDQRSGNSPDVSSDVFALGVYGYRLFTGRYLHGDKQTNSSPEDPVTTAPAPSVVRSDLPNWVDDVLGRCLERDPVNRYRDAGELCRVIEDSIKTGNAPGGNSPWSRRTVLVPSSAVETIKKSTDLTTTPKKDVIDPRRSSKEMLDPRRSSKEMLDPRRGPGKGLPAERGADGQLPSRRGEAGGLPAERRKKGEGAGAGVTPKNAKKGVAFMAWALAFTVGLCAAGFVFFFVNNWESAPPEVAKEPPKPDDPIRFHSEYAPPQLKPLIIQVSSADTPLEERQAALLELGESDDPAAFEVLVSLAQSSPEKRLKTEAQRLLLSTVRRQQLTRSADVIEKWFRGVRQSQKDPSVAPAFPHLLRAVERARPIKVRREALQQAFGNEPVTALQLAAALALEDSEEQFLPVLRKFLAGEMSEQELEGKGLGALLLSHKSLSVFIDGDLLRTIKRFSDSDLRWAILRSAESDRTMLIDLAGEAVARRMLPPYQNVFLEELIKTDRENAPWTVQQSLVKSALGQIADADVQNFARWISVSSERVLLAVCAVADDQSIATAAFDVLAARSLRTEPAASLVSWARTKFWDYRKKMVKGIGVLGLTDIASPEDMSFAFESLMPFSQGGLFKVMVGTQNSYLIREAVLRLGAITPSVEILPLLDHENKDIRIEAVKALKGRNELAVLQGILKAFEREKDEDVRATYLEIHWVTRDRVNKRDGM